MPGRIVSLSPELAEALRHYKELREKELGRPLRPDEKIFDMTEKEMDKVMVETMQQAGIAPELIHAYRKTGFILTDKNKHLFSPEELEEWNQAIQEFRSE